MSIAAAQRKLSTLTIIHGAMLIGLIIAVIVFCTSIIDFSKRDDRVATLTLMAAVGAILAYGVAMVLPTLFRGSVSGRKKEAAQKIANNMMTEQISRLALFEGGALLNLIVMVLEPDYISLGVTGMGIFLMICIFKTPRSLSSTFESRFKQYLESGR